MMMMHCKCFTYDCNQCRQHLTQSLNTGGENQQAFKLEREEGFESLKSDKRISQGCQRFETSVFFSEKINISTTGGSRVGFFQPDTNHP